jgi:phage-related baseplate assembly protein
MTVDITTLFTATTAARILSTGLALAEALGLSTTTWRDGDPEPTLYGFLADMLSDREDVITELIKAGFLSVASGTWLTLVAQDMYGVTRTAAEASAPTVTLSNSGGGSYTKGVGECIVKASSTGELFRSSEAFTLASGPGTTASVAFEAENAGTVGNVALDDVDTVISTMLGVTITTSTAAVGVDEQSDESLRTECTSTLGSVSVNGPPDAYNAVALDSDLTGESTLTRATTSEDASDGTVQVYVATATGAPTAGAVTAAETAIELWATPATITPTVSAATEVTQAVTQSVSGTDIPAGAEAAVEALVIAYFGTIAIGGLVAVSAITALTQDYLVGAGATLVTVTTSVPSADVSLAAGTVVVAGTVTVTEV